MPLKTVFAVSAVSRTATAVGRAVDNLAAARSDEGQGIDQEYGRRLSDLDFA